MSWEPSFRRADNTSLGSRDDVFAALTRAFPGTEFKLSLGGRELLAEIERSDPGIPQSSRDVILRTPSQWHGVYDTVPVTIEFTIPADEPIVFIMIRSVGDHVECQNRLRLLAVAEDWLLEGDLGA
jgi:hypothetical protein